MTTLTWLFPGEMAESRLHAMKQNVEANLSTRGIKGCGKEDESFGWTPWLSASISGDIAREGRSSQPKLRLRVPLKKPPTKVSRGPNTPASERKQPPKNLIAVTTNASSLHRSETLRVPPLQVVEETVPRRRCISKGTAIPFERSAAAKTQTFQSDMETLAPITDKRFPMRSPSSPNRSPSSYSRQVTRAPDLA